MSEALFNGALLFIALLYGVYSWLHGESFWYNFVAGFVGLAVILAFITANVLGWLIVGGIVFVGWAFAV
jgi:hypothetical protein